MGDGIGVLVGITVGGCWVAVGLAPMMLQAMLFIVINKINHKMGLTGEFFISIISR